MKISLKILKLVIVIYTVNNNSVQKYYQCKSVHRNVKDFYYLGGFLRNPVNVFYA